MDRPVVTTKIAESLEDLQKQAQLKKILTAKPSAKTLINGADRIYAEAVFARKKGNNELAYLYFFRYVETINFAQKQNDYKTYAKLINPKNVKDAVETLEMLQPILEAFYNSHKSENKANGEREKSNGESGRDSNGVADYADRLGSLSLSRNGGDHPSKVDPLKPVPSQNGIVKTNGTEKPVEETGNMTPVALKNLLEQKTKRVLLVDCRDSYDFTTNHINHSNCICIPQTSLRQGMSANSILTALKGGCPESYIDWLNRGKFDYIILYDWNSSFGNRLPTLSIVYDALLKWDPENKNSYKVSVLQGGLKTMYYKYPFLLTNPQTGVSAASKLNGTSSGSINAKDLDDISYPDMDEPKPRPEVNFDLDKNTSVPSNNINLVSDVPKTTGPGGLVSVDRSTKPLRKVVNGSGSHDDIIKEVASPQVDTSSEKTDAPVTQFAEALDDVIKNMKDISVAESEVSSLHHKTLLQSDETMQRLLQEKETQVEALTKALEQKTSQLTQLEQRYLKHKDTLYHNQLLPSVRPSPTDKLVEDKMSEKARLDEIVRELRIKRKQELWRKSVENAAQELSNDYLPVISKPSGIATPAMKPVGGSTQLPVIPAVVPPTVPSAALKPVTSSSSTASGRPVSQDAGGVTRIPLKDEPSDHPRSTSLKRSHSHPNIAQNHDEGAGLVSSQGSQAPRVFRGLKPSGPRPPPEQVVTPRIRSARNFEAVSSTEPSHTGLKNLGNTCYMNSVIQCLFHTRKLVEYLRKDEFIKEWHPQRSPTKGEATEELAAAVKQMHSGHRSISLLDLKETVGRYQPTFRGTEQQDSHEFITIVLDWLHEEMNRVPEKKPLQEQKNDGLSDEDAANKAWDDYKRSNDSKISELFCGQQKSCVTCASCNRESVTFEPFFILSVPIPGNGKKCDIQQCIDLYTSQEELSGWNCAYCKKRGKATKKIDLWRLPPYLIIHLQRFYYDGYWRKRIAEVEFSVEHLNMQRKALGRPSSAGVSSYDYQLYGVSNHYGTMDAGHYTAYCRDNYSSQWLKFDDSEVRPIEPRDVSTAAAYILFYQNRTII